MIDLQRAAVNSKRLLFNPRNEPSLRDLLKEEAVSTAHLLDMLEQIQQKVVTGGKAHRWLGYVQGVLVMQGLATLDDVKHANDEAKAVPTVTIFEKIQQ